MICTLSTYCRFQIGSKKRVGKAEKHNVLDRVLPQVVVDAKNVGLMEDLVQYLFSVVRELRFVPKGFSTTTRAPYRQPEA